MVEYLEDYQFYYINMNTFVEIENIIKLLQEDYMRENNSDQFDNDLITAINALKNLKKYY